MLTIPDILNKPEFYDIPLSYKWDKKISETISVDAKYENEKLSDAFDLLSHKAMIGLSAALSEWIYWQLYYKEGHKQAYDAIESMWVSIIDKKYVDNKLMYISSPKEPDGRIEGPIWRMLFCLTLMERKYLKGTYAINEDLITLTVLTRYITNEKALFDKWLGNCLSRLSESFPARYNSIEMVKTNEEEYQKGVYDSSDEVAVPREFYFNANYQYDEQSVASSINSYLQSVSYADNPYLCSPEVMIEKDFKGIPYQYKIQL